MRYRAINSSETNYLICGLSPKSVTTKTVNMYIGNEISSAPTRFSYPWKHDVCVRSVSLCDKDTNVPKSSVTDVMEEVTRFDTVKHTDRHR